MCPCPCPLWIVLIPLWLIVYAFLPPKYKDKVKHKAKEFIKWLKVKLTER